MAFRWNWNVAKLRIMRLLREPPLAGSEKSRMCVVAHKSLL